MSNRKPDPRARPKWRTRFVAAHRWLGLAAAIFWLIQAGTGVMIVFHWEIDDALVAGRPAKTDLPAIQSRLGLLAPAGSGRRIVSVWTSAGAPDRYDVTIADPRAGKQVVRIAGDGTVLRTRGGARSVIDTLVVLHQTLLLGDAGGWIVGISGDLLLSNLLFGLVAAWPRWGTWRRAVVPIRVGGPAARAYSWHRALGLFGVAPALLLVSVGVSLVFEDGTARLVGAAPLALPPRPGAPVVGFAAAVETAERAVPGSRLTAVATMPGPDDATYRIRVLAPDEWRRAYGTSTVYVDAVTGAVRGAYPANAAPRANTFMNALYAFHTGEILGLVGRLLVMATGLWLATMVVLGLILWQRRRHRRS